MVKGQYYVKIWRENKDGIQLVVQGITDEPYITLCNLPDIAVRNQAFGPNVRNSNCVELYGLKVNGLKTEGSISCESYTPVKFCITPIDYI